MSCMVFTFCTVLRNILYRLHWLLCILCSGSDESYNIPMCVGACARVFVHVCARACVCMCVCAKQVKIQSIKVNIIIIKLTLNIILN
jgi:hypothetical protein